MAIKSPRIAVLLLLLVSFVWGGEFVLIDLAVARIPSHTFNAIRFTLASISLLPLLWFTRNKDTQYSYTALLKAGLLLGLLLFIGFYTQTEGLRFTSVSNAGFITGLSVPLVPFLGFLLLRTHAAKSVWIGVVAATTGLYLLTIGDKLEFNYGDILVLICAFAFAREPLNKSFAFSASPEAVSYEKDDKENAICLFKSSDKVDDGFRLRPSGCSGLPLLCVSYL